MQTSRFYAFQPKNQKEDDLDDDIPEFIEKKLSQQAKILLNEFVKKYLKWISTFLVLTGILLTNLNMYQLI